MTSCACGSGLNYSECCEPYIKGEKPAPTAEALMRSRYTAYTKCATTYLKETLAPESLSDYSEKDVVEWSKKSEWMGLEILSASEDTVEFIAKYKTQGKVFEHHEVSKFKKIKNHWYFVDGDSHVHEEGKGHHDEPVEPAPARVRVGPKIGRNDPCSCGSGKKFKKCCGA